MDVEWYVVQLFLVFYSCKFIFTLEEAPRPVVFYIEIMSVAYPEFFHKFGNSVLSKRFYQEMEVVRHQTIRENPHRNSLACFAHQIDEETIIRCSVVDR